MKLVSFSTSHLSGKGNLRLQGGKKERSLGERPHIEVIFNNMNGMAINQLQCMMASVAHWCIPMHHFL